MPRIVNTSFFADPENGVRRPKQTNTIVDDNDDPVIDDPIIITPDPEDPTDPGDGTGSPIEDPDGDGTDGGGTVTLGNVPNITRRIAGQVYTTSQDVFVGAGGTLSITYIADGDCTMLPKLGYEDSITSYSTNGREMTITWSVPNDEPGDSWWVGVEVWVYGGDNSEEYAVHYDRVHIAKSAGDVIKKTSISNLQDSLENDLTVAGRTVIVPDKVYSNNRDVIHVGHENYLGGGSYSTANGVHTKRSITAISHQRQRFESAQTADVSKYTVFMPETPCGGVIDRNRRGGGIGIAGNLQYWNNNTGNGNRETVGIKVKGFSLVNPKSENVSPNSSGLMWNTRSMSCSIDACYYLVDLVYNGDGWTGDGACSSNYSAQNSGFCYGGGIGNHRLLNQQANDTQNSYHSRILTANGCTQLVGQQRTQTFTSYPSQYGHYRNCIAIDGFLYNSGTVKYGSGEPIPNYAFNATNAGNNNLRHEACVMFNDVRGFSQTNSSGAYTSDTDDFIDCVGFHTRRNNSHGGNQAFEHMRGGPFSITRCTFGRNEEFPGSSVETDGQNRNSVDSQINGMFINHPSWDYPISSDNVIGSGSYRYSTLNNLGVAGSQRTVNTSTTNNTTNYFEYSSANTPSSGFVYWFRAEPGSDLEQRDAAARDVFCARGRYGIDPTSQRTGFYTVFNGKNGNPYVNWIQRSPWHELRSLWRQYDCTSNGSRYRGNVGWAAEGVHPVDYLLRQGTRPSKPINTPYIEDIYVHADASGDSVLTWRPICPAYRATITGYDIYVDNQIIASDVAKQTTSFTITGLNSGVRAFNVVVKDATYGDSGKSRTVTRTV